MKTVPTVRLADTADAVVLPDLPEEIRLAMTDIAGAARDGLLAMSVAAGMAVMAAMFEAEMSEACGPKGKHDPNRFVIAYGSPQSYRRQVVVFAAARVPCTPRRRCSRCSDGGTGKRSRRGPRSAAMNENQPASFQ